MSRCYQPDSLHRVDIFRISFSVTPQTGLFPLPAERFLGMFYSFLRLQLSCYFLRVLLPPIQIMFLIILILFLHSMYRNSMYLCYVYVLVLPWTLSVYPHGTYLKDAEHRPHANLSHISYPIPNTWKLYFKHSLNVCCVLDIVQGTRDIEVIKTNLVLMELTFRYKELGNKYRSVVFPFRTVSGQGAKCKVDFTKEKIHACPALIRVP